MRLGFLTRTSILAPGDAVQGAIAANMPDEHGSKPSLGVDAACGGDASAGKHQIKRPKDTIVTSSRLMRGEGFYAYGAISWTILSAW